MSNARGSKQGAGGNLTTYIGGWKGEDSPSMSAQDHLGLLKVT